MHQIKSKSVCLKPKAFVTLKKVDYPRILKSFVGFGDPVIRGNFRNCNKNVNYSKLFRGYS